MNRPHPTSPTTSDDPTADARPTSGAHPTSDPDWATALVRGVAAGLVGGLAFGAAMAHLGLLPSIALLVRADAAAVGFVVHLVVAALIGAGFGLLVWSQRPEAGETLFWGVTYGALWWFLGAATLLPVISGQPLSWSVEEVGQLLPALVGHLLYGAVTGLTLVVLRRPSRSADPSLTVGSAIRGGLAGVVAAATLALVLDNRLGSPTMSASTSEVMAGLNAASQWLLTMTLGLMAGVGYAALFPSARVGAGPAAIRGLAYGFLWWLLAALTLLPLLDGRGLAWSLEEIQANFATFPGYLLFLGVGLSLGYHGISAVQRGLLADGATIRSQEGVGAQGLRAVGHGALSGLLGGLVFTVVMVQIGFLTTVSQIVGVDSNILGFVVHLLIANLIGVAYGMAFVRRSNDFGSALGWGVSYGVLWWLLGPLTLLPLLLGDGPQWTATAAAEAYPALVGHVAYGAVLGLGFFRLERRHNPWWITRNDAEAARADRAARQLRGSAPALWTLTVLIALTIPVLLGS